MKKQKKLIQIAEGKDVNRQRGLTLLGNLLVEIAEDEKRLAAKKQDIADKTAKLAALEVKLKQELEGKAVLTEEEKEFLRKLERSSRVGGC